jgi:hypothetical protein
MYEEGSSRFAQDHDAIVLREAQSLVHSVSPYRQLKADKEALFKVY